jgi:hypothetical protein
MRRTVLAIALAATAVVSVVSSAVAVFLDHFVVDMLLLTLAVVAMATVGAVLAIRVPSNNVGWLLLVSAAILGVEFLGLVYAEGSITYAGGSWPGTAVAAWVYSNLFALPVLIMTVAIPLIYPNGRLLSPRWRWLVGFLVLSLVQSLAQGFRPGLIPDTDVENPFGVAALVPLLDASRAPAFSILGIPVLVGPIAAVVIRFRRGTAAERAQLKWLFAATTFAVIAWLVVTVGGVMEAPAVTTFGWYGGLLGFTGFPLAIGIAVLRYRLYEIDRIISRTIAWAVVTGVLVSVFAAGVVALQAALIGFTQGQTLAVAVSTLGAAALFQPLRRRVQRVVDRRFDRATYDAQRTVEAFAVRLRDVVALDAVVADLEQTVADSIRPVTFALWLRPASGSTGPN